MSYIITIDRSTQKAMAEAAAPYLTGDADCRKLERTLTAMMEKHWPRLDVKAVHIHTDYAPVKLRFGVVVDGILDQGLIFERNPDA